MSRELLQVLSKEYKVFDIGYMDNIGKVWPKPWRLRYMKYCSNSKKRSVRFFDTIDELEKFKEITS